jgi:glycosyltransferase involved in cell wall biosynthesis
MQPELSLSVFFPAYNDELSITALIEKTFEVLTSYTGDFEVIIINDGSEDHTAEVVRELQTTYGPRLRLVNHERNLGYGAALQSGFRAAQNDLVFYTDGDGQYDVAELPLLLEQMQPGVGLVNGFKVGRSDAWYRRLLGSTYKLLMRILFHIRLSDIDCDFRLIRRSLLEKIELTSTSGTICLELVHKLERSGARTVEVPVHHRARLYGRSQFFRIGPLFRTLKQLVPLFFRLKMS